MLSSKHASTVLHLAESFERSRLPMIQVSRRVRATDAPVIGKTKALIAGVEGVRSLAQGDCMHSTTAENEDEVKNSSD